MNQPTLFDLEEWRPVPGWEGYYEVSSYGNVRSVDRTYTTRDGHERHHRGRILKPGIHTSGYHMVGLNRDGTRKTALVHQLVAAAFIGPRPPGHEIRHWDDNPTNNTIWNLSYGTPSDNRHDSVRNGTHHEAGKTHCKRGHEFTPENTRPQHNGKGRVCLACKRMRNQIDNARRRERNKAA